MPGFFNASSLPRKTTISKIPGCGACKLYKQCNSPKMEPTGHGQRRILIVGEAPGENEDERGKQFIGKSGQLLEQELRRVGIDMRKDCWITNAAICWPGPGNPTPTPQQVEWCRPNLFNTLEKYDPEIIMCFGGTAIKSLIGHIWKEDVGKVFRWVGFRIPNSKPNAWICPTYHPSYLLRQNDPVLDLHFHKHLKRASKLEGRPWDVPPDYESLVEVILDPVEAAKKLKRMAMYAPGRLLAFDYENDMLKPDNPEGKIWTCSFSDGRTAIAFPWHGKVIKVASEILFDPSIGKIIQNMKYEQRWTMEKLGKPIRNIVWCTMQAAHILDNREDGITGLKFQAFVHLGGMSYEQHIAPYLRARSSNSLNRIKEIDKKQLLKYNGLDSLLSYLLAKKQTKEMKHPLAERFQ